MGKNNYNLSPEEQKRLKDMESSISQELQLIKGLDESTKKTKNDDIKSMIKYYINLTNNIEDRRTRIHDFTLQMLMICITAAGLLYTQYQKICPIIFWTITAVLLEQIIFSFVSVFFYEKQSGFRYPFLDLEQYGNTWKWFYYGNRELLKINACPIKTSKKFGETIEPYLKSFGTFTRNYREENLDAEILNNIQQLHLLQVHNFYKNRFYLQLTNIRKWSIILFPIVAAIVIVILYLHPILTRG